MINRDSFTLDTILLVTRTETTSPMSYAIIVLLLALVPVGRAESLSQFDRVAQRLKASAEQLSMINFLEVPDADSYLNYDLVKNAPHKMNLTKELTKIIREWSPRLLALDPTCPYYFSTLVNASQIDEDFNLLSHLQARTCLSFPSNASLSILSLILVQSNVTVKHPFLNVLPQSYRHAIPLLSIFQCSEYADPLSSTPFFHNIELLVGSGKSELPLERKSNLYSQHYCSLSGWPHFLLVNQTKQPSVTYDAQRLLTDDSLAQVDFLLTTVPPGHCLFVPAGWVVGAQLNSSMIVIFTTQKMEALEYVNQDDYQPLPCTAAANSTFDKVDFTVLDSFNMSSIGLIVYFYQYLNPPMFDREFTSETFLNYVREDKNVSQLIMNWTPELTKLIQSDLFESLDINHSGKFTIDDYFDIKQSNIDRLQTSIYDVLEQLRQTVLVQYNELNANIMKLSEQLGGAGAELNTRAVLESMIENLPESIKAQLREKNIDVKAFLDRGDKGKSKVKRPSTGQERVTPDDASVFFDQSEGDQSTVDFVQEDEEEEILAEPIDIETKPERTDL